MEEARGMYDYLIKRDNVRKLRNENNGKPSRSIAEERELLEGGYLHSSHD